MSEIKIYIKDIIQDIPNNTPVVLRDNATQICFFSALNKKYINSSDLNFRVWKHGIENRKYYITVSVESEV